MSRRVKNGEKRYLVPNSKAGHSESEAFLIFLRGYDQMSVVSSKFNLSGQVFGADTNYDRQAFTVRRTRSHGIPKSKLREFSFHLALHFAVALFLTVVPWSDLIRIAMFLAIMFLTKQ